MTSDTRQTDGVRPIDTRLRISALWIAVLLIFAYVDLFSLYRRDVRDDIEAGTIGGFEVARPSCSSPRCTSSSRHS